MSDFVSIMLLACLGSFFALLGGVIFLYKKSWSSWLSQYSIPFAAGVLITVSLIGLLPEAVHAIGQSAFIIALFTLLGAFIFEHFLFGIHHHEESHHHHDTKNSIPLVVLGDTIHNFIDGVAIAATYMISPGLGLITALSTFLHEVPHEIGDFGIMLKAGWKRKNILFINIISASTALIGALFLVVIGQNEEVIGILLAASAGLFLYLGASDFLPETTHSNSDSKDSRIKSVLVLLAGVIIMFSSFTLIPHSHENEQGEETHIEEDIHQNEKDYDDHV